MGLFGGPNNQNKLLNSGINSNFMAKKAISRPTKSDVPGRAQPLVRRSAVRKDPSKKYEGGGKVTRKKDS